MTRCSRHSVALSSFIFVALFAVFFGLSAHAQTDILEYHGNTSTSSGVNGTETLLTPASVNVTSFGKQFSTPITDIPNLTGIPLTTLPTSINYAAAGGQAYAEPLVKTGVNITTGTNQGIHNVVFVATTMDSLYAIDASGGTILWKDSFIYNAGGNPNPLNPTIPSGVTAVPGGYGTETNSQDISPWIGIIGTPVIDGVNGYIYFVAKTREAQGNELLPHYVETLHKVRLADGLDANTIIADTTLLSSSTYTYNSGPYVVGTGNGAITVNGQSRVYLNAVRQNFRPAAVLYGGRIYIASGSHGDNDTYHGWVLTYDASSLTLNGVWNSTPNSSQGEGGIWQGGGSVIIDPATGYLYFAIGNGGFDGVSTNGVITGLDGPNGATGFPVNGDYGDCFVKLALDSTTTQASQGKNGWGLKTVDYFAPYNNASLDAGDTDLGSGGPTLLPDAVGSTAHPHLLIGGGKEGKLYLIDRDNMGKFSATDNVVQVVNGVLSGSLSVPSYFNGILYASPGYGGSPVSWTIANGVVNTASVQTAPEAIAFPGCSPYISANGTTNGVMWQVDHGTGQLRAYDAGNLNKGAIWTSNLNAARDALGSSVKFAVPTPANGCVFVGTSDHLVVYGPPVAATAPPAAPSNLTATVTGSTSISLAWVDNSNNESGFLLERSSDGVTFTQIAALGVNVTSYGDSGLSSQATYYYRVRATNLFNTVSYSAYSNTASATTAAVGTTAPLYLYSFDEGSGTTTIDSAGGNNGTLVGSPLPTWITPGRIGSANLSFSGTGVYNMTNQSAVQTAGDLSPILGTTSSLLFWIKTTQVGNNTQYQAPAVTGVEQSGAGNDIGWGYLDATGRICLAVGDSGTVKSANPINDGKWHHVALTRDAVTGIVNVYVDAVLSSSATFETGNKTSHFQLIGARTVVQSDGVTVTGANYLNGQLDDVRIYNIVVNQALINTIAGLPAAATSLVVTPASGTELDLSWVDNATNATGYEVWSSISGGAYTRLAQLSSTATTYINSGLTQGTTYAYFIRAISLAGSADSAIVTSATPVPPATPTGATVTNLTSTEVDLSWVDNANNESGYRVLRSSSNSPFVQIAQLPPNTITYADTSVTSGVTYDYHIQAYNIAGVSDFTGLTVTVPSGPVPPAPVTNTTGTALSNGTGINLSWVASTSTVTGYNVWGSIGGGTFTEIAQLPSTATSYSVTSLSPGVTYSYYIQAVGAGGSTNGSTITVTTPTVAPTTVYVSDLAWVQVANGWGPVEKDTSNGENAAGDGHTISIRGTTFTKGLGCHAYSEINVPLNGLYSIFSSSIGIDDEVGGNGSVDFQVYADGTKIYDSGTLTGKSPLQTTGTLNVTGVTTLKLEVAIVGTSNSYDHADWAGAQLSTSTAVPPAAPTGAKVSNLSSTEVDLAWTDNATNETAYLVLRSTDNVNFTAFTPLPANTITYADKSVVIGTTYYYRIEASNAAGVSGFTGVTATIPPLVTPPAAVTGLAATATSSTTVNLSWVDSTSTVTGYNVWQSISGGTFIQLASLSATATSYPLTGLTPSTTYSYYVQAVGSGGTTNGSTVSVTTPAAPVNPPAAVTNLTATATSSTAVNLAWVDSTSTVTGYTVWQSISGGTFAQLASLSATATSYPVTGLSASTKYSYYVQAVGAGGTTNGTTVSVTTPAAPTTVYVSDLAWVQIANGWGPVEKDTSNGENAAGDGHTISIRGTTFAKGLGCHALSQINVPLNKIYKTFTSYVGIDDEVGGNGSVDFQVLADGVKIYDSGTLTGKSPIATTGALNVTGVTTLELLVNVVGTSNSYDHSDWAGAQVSP
jgi:hypothetical protein